MQGTRKSLFESKVETIHDIPVSTGEIREPDRLKPKVCEKFACTRDERKDNKSIIFCRI